MPQKTKLQRALITALRQDADSITAEYNLTNPQRDYIAKLATDVLRIQKQIKHKDAQIVGNELTKITYDRFLSEEDSPHKTFSVFESLLKKRSGGPLKSVPELRKLLTETFHVIDS